VACRAVRRDDLATSIDEYAAILRKQIVDLRDEMRVGFG